MRKCGTAALLAVCQNCKQFVKKIEGENNPTQDVTNNGRGRSAHGLLTSSNLIPQSWLQNQSCLGAAAKILAREGSVH
jgi:hypothetical protein